MEQIGLSEEEKEQRRKKLDLIETQFLRARRIRLTKDTFATISVIGRGSFGEVRNPIIHWWVFPMPNMKAGPACSDERDKKAVCYEKAQEIKDDRARTGNNAAYTISLFIFINYSIRILRLST